MVVDLLRSSRFYESSAVHHVYAVCVPSHNTQVVRNHDKSHTQFFGEFLHEFENLREWFQALYEVLLGQSQGPRFGSFAALYGVANTARLMDEALARD